MDIDHEGMMYIPPEVEVCLFGLDQQLGQFLKHELMMRKIPNFSPTESLFNPRHGELMLHLADGLRPRAFLNCVDDPQILVNLCECCVKYNTRFVHVGKKNTDIPKMFNIHNFASIQYDEPDIAMVKKLLDNLDHVIGFHTYKEGKFTTTI